MSETKQSIVLNKEVLLPAGVILSLAGTLIGVGMMFQQLNDLTRRVATTETKIETFASSISTVNERLTRVETQTGLILTGVTDLRNDLKDLKQ